MRTTPLAMNCLVTVCIPTLGTFMVEVPHFVSDRYDSSVQINFSISESYIETIGVETTITNRNYPFICIYSPPSGDFDSFMISMNDLFLCYW